MESLKYSVLIDYILKALRELKNFDSTKYASLVNMLKVFDYKASFSQVQEIGKYLEARGWAKAHFILGDVNAQIATPGLLYLEEKDEVFHETYKKFIEKKIKDKGKEAVGIRIFEENYNPIETINTLIDSIRTKIISNNLPTDYLADLDIIKVEISKFKPDFRLIETKLNNLRPISILSSEIEELKSFIPPDYE